jgi:hypothetical protein
MLVCYGTFGVLAVCLLTAFPSCYASSCRAFVAAVDVLDLHVLKLFGFDRQPLGNRGMSPFVTQILLGGGFGPS